MGYFHQRYHMVCPSFCVFIDDQPTEYDGNLWALCGPAVELWVSCSPQHRPRSAKRTSLRGCWSPDLGVEGEELGHLHLSSGNLTVC